MFYNDDLLAQVVRTDLTSSCIALTGSNTEFIRAEITTQPNSTVYVHLNATVSCFTTGTFEMKLYRNSTLIRKCLIFSGTPNENISLFVNTNGRISGGGYGDFAFIATLSSVTPDALSCGIIEVITGSGYPANITVLEVLQ
jgi:hypothetical protein